MSILIVDDSVEQRELLAMILKTAGYRSLLFTESAEEALKRLGIGADSRPSERIEVVLMDLLMPGLVWMGWRPAVASGQRKDSSICR